MNCIRIHCEEQKYYPDVKIFVLNIEITNRCFFSKRDIKVFISPTDSGTMEENFEQRLYNKKTSSFSAADISVNPIKNDFILPFTLKGSQSITGNVIIALNEDRLCNSIQIVSSKGKVLSELKIRPNDVEIKNYIIEQ